MAGKGQKKTLLRSAVEGKGTKHGQSFSEEEDAAIQAAAAAAAAASKLCDWGGLTRSSPLFSAGQRTAKELAQRLQRIKQKGKGAR